MSKVARVIEEWDLHGVGDQLEASWLGSGDEQRSLRALADWFNRQLLVAAHKCVDEPFEAGQLERTYELLTDDVSSGVRTEAETRLKQRGIDVGALRDAFVSHQSIYIYLTQYRGVSRPADDTSDADQIEKTGDAIQRLVSRTKAVVRNNLETLHNTDRITIGSFTVLVNVQVSCQDCESQYSVEDLLSNRGCACSETE